MAKGADLAATFPSGPGRHGYHPSRRHAQRGAEGSQACAERSRVVQKLADKFGETLRSLGLHRDDGWSRSTAPRKPAPGPS